MRQAAKHKGNRSQVVKTVTIPSPVGGWNARDSVADMPSTDANVLENWFPATTECILRYGYSQHATGLPAQVESLFVYSGGATQKMFAVSNGACYDVTAAGAVGASVWSGKSNSRWQYANIATAGGNYIVCANGVDAPYSYNGTVWANPAITVVTATSLDNPILHKSRLWFTETGTLKTWYLPVNSIAGAAASLDMSAVAQYGGYIISHGTWTIDAGAGVDDYYVAVTSEGEVIVYQGTDPSDSTKWALKGVWRLGTPVGKRCLYKYAGDLLLISQDGILPLSGALQSSRVNPKVALTDKIQFAVSNAVSDYGTTFGWQLMYFPRENQLWLNVPVSVGTQEQYVMNTISQAWCKYTGWAANCWEILDDRPYFGGNGVVCKAWNGNSDNGTTISASAVQAFSSYGTAQTKRFTAMRPTFRASGFPTVQAAINVDFDLYASASALNFTASTYGVWDSSTWDSPLWGGGFVIFEILQGAAAVGYYGAPQVRAAGNGIDVRWVTTGVIFETGSIL